MRKWTNQDFESLLILLFCLVLVSSLVLIFTFSPGIIYYDVYDYCEGLPLAEATIQAKSLIHPNYIYYYILPLGPNVLIAPFILLFGYTMFANQAGMIVYLCMYLGVLYKLAKALYEDKKSRLLFCIVLSLFVYTYIGDNLLHHLLAYGIGFVCFLGELACVIEIRRQQNVRKNTILLAILAFWSSANGISPAALSGFSILAGLLFTGIRNGKWNTKENLYVLKTMFPAMLIGFVLYIYLNNTAMTMNYTNLSRFILDKANTVVYRIFNYMPADYLKLFYYDPVKVPLFSLSGFLCMIRLCFALAVPVFPVWIFRKYSVKTTMDDDRSLIFWSCGMVILVCLAQYILMTSSVLRFLFNGVLGMFLICAVLFTDHQEKIPAGIPVLAALIVLMTVKMFVVTYPYGLTVKKQYEDLNDLLDQENLPFGYCFAQNPRPLEILSQHKNKIYPIYYDEGKERFKVSYDRTYTWDQKKPEGIDRFYIAFDPAKPEDQFYAKFGQDLLDSCREKITFNNLTLLIYDMEDWDRVMSE
ncbi:MAG: hypothetical protein IKE36_10000 [Solobacterium sp.]|nr:hypothetical protein [Solobacterium sp.]